MKLLFMSLLVFLFATGVAGAEDKKNTPDVQAALKDCAAEQGATLPQPGQPPSGKIPDKGKMDACMSKKGFTRPENFPAPPGSGS